MPNYNGLIKTIKQIVVETVATTKPADIMNGVVTSTSPLQVQVEQSFIIGKDNLFIPESLTDYEIDIKIGDDKKTCKIFNSLKTGDKVVLIRQSGGQKFLIFDKVV